MIVAWTRELLTEEEREDDPQSRLAVRSPSASRARSSIAPNLDGQPDQGGQGTQPRRGAQAQGGRHAATTIPTTTFPATLCSAEAQAAAARTEVHREAEGRARERRRLIARCGGQLKPITDRWWGDSKVVDGMMYRRVEHTDGTRDVFPVKRLWPARAFPGRVESSLDNPRVEE